MKGRDFMCMKKLGFVVALGALSLGANAQRGKGGERPPPPPLDAGVYCHCHGGGVDCWFGSAQGCQVTCKGPCECEGGECNFGFPKAPTCECH